MKRNKNDIDLMALIDTQRDHINTLLRIIKHLQTEMKLATDIRIDREEETKIINELIYWIDKLMEYEK